MTTFSPIYQYICKVASRCNLDCDYCYMYRHVDQSWRQQPRKMDMRTVIQLGKRVNEHALQHQMETVEIVMHGGEPLSLGLEYLKDFYLTIQENTPDTKVKLGIQTNGVLFNDKIFEFCITHKISVGLSMDGPRWANDRHRLDHAGRSSFDRTEKCLKLLASKEGRQIWSGILSVIDITNDPLEVYSYFQAFDPPSLNFLLPLGHYDLLPPGKEQLESTPYADWLLTIFYKWYSEQPQKIEIRRFNDVMALLMGARGASEEWGLQPIDFISIETNGDIEATDTLKSTYPGATKLGLNIFENTFDDVLTSPKVIARQQRWNSLPSTCQSCNLAQVCGGGYFPHRYSHRNQFDNPSVYCADLMKLIREIRRYLVADLQKLRDYQKQKTLRSV